MTTVALIASIFIYSNNNIKKIVMFNYRVKTTIISPLYQDIYTP